MVAEAADSEALAVVLEVLAAEAAAAAGPAGDFEER